MAGNDLTPPVKCRQQPSGSRRRARTASCEATPNAAGRSPTLILRLTIPPEGTVDLTRAQVDAYADSQASWPKDLRLRGFTYGGL
jgi:hypothetical protein